MAQFSHYICLVTSRQVELLLVLRRLYDVTRVRFTRRAVSLANLNIITLYSKLDYRKVMINI
jgi:hypothetical protein